MEKYNRIESFRHMELGDLKNKLDNIFEITGAVKDVPFSSVFPEIYENKGFDMHRYFEDDFLKSFNGLMLNNGATIKKVFGTVFLDSGVLDKIFQEKETDVLILSHHPTEDETGGVGFIPIDEDNLKRMREMRISVYSVHAPLDTNESISTAGSIANSLNLREFSRHIEAVDGFEGIVGELPEALEFEEFINLIKDILGNKKINFIKRKDMVKKIGIVPGGGTDPTLIKKAMDFGCDTYLTGEYYNKLKTPRGDIERDSFNKLVDRLDINMIEGSHYSTEKLVFLKEIPHLFATLGLPYQFVEQNDPWY